MRFGIEAGEHTNELSRELGIRGVSVGADELVSRGSAAVRRALDARNQSACQIAAFSYNALRSDAHAKSIVRTALELAPDIGSPCVVIAGGNYNPSLFGATDRRNRAPGAIDTLARELEELVAVAEQHGVGLSIEPYAKGAIYSAAAFEELHRRIGSEYLRVNLDITSLYDLGDLISPDELCRSAVPVLARHVGLIHVKGVGLEEGFHIHAGLMPITEDPTDWELVLSLAAPACPASTWLLLEHLLSPEEARSSAAHVREIAGRLGVPLE